MSRPVTLLIPLLLLAPVIGPTACDKSATQAPSEDDATDRLTRDLLEALRSGEADALATVASPALAADLDERDLAVIARTLDWLGGVEALERQGEEPVVGGVQRSYAVEFGRGSVDLSVTAVDGKVEGFELEQERWLALVDRAAEASAGSLRVAEFRYHDGAGQALGGKLDPAAIHYELALEGLDAQLREHHVSVAKAVFDAGGNQVYRQDQDDDLRFPQAEPGSSGGRITGMVAVPSAGEYELELKIRDLIGGQSMTHRESFVID